MVLFIIYILLAIAIFAYGLLILSVGAGTFFFIFWFLLAAFFGFLAYAVRKHLWRKLSLKLRRIFLVLLSLGLIAFALVETLVLSCFGEEGEPGLDYIIVLGAQVYESGPSAILRYRLDAAADYLNENPDTRCIVTGAQGWNEPWPEAEGMKDYLVSCGIDEARIIVEPEAEDTIQNIKYSMEQMDLPASVGIVTNNFHMFRALQIARSQGLTDVCGISAYSHPLYLPNNMVREFFAEIKVLILGYGY